MNSEGEKLCATVLFIANDPAYVLVRRRVKETKPLNTNTVCCTRQNALRNEIVMSFKMALKRPIERKKHGSAFACMHREPTRSQAAQKIRKRSSFVERNQVQIDNFLAICVFKEHGHSVKEKRAKESESSVLD